MLPRPTLALLLALAPLACGDSDVETLDATAGQDATPAPDAAARPDATTPMDATAPDATTPDATPPMDASAPDAEPADTGEAPDAEPADAGETPDASPGPCGDGVLDETTEVCDPGLSPCCAADCSGPAALGTVCRGAASECDAEELCDGASLDCPADEALNGGEACTGCPEGEYCAGCYEGACADSPVFCADLLARGQAITSGIYEVRPSATASVAADDPRVQVYCDMTTSGGGWTMVYKKSRLDTRRGDTLWTGAAVNAEDTSFLDPGPESVDYTNAFQSDYWGAFSEARIEVVTGTITQKFIEFDTTGTTNLTWFTPTRHTSSSWTDLPTDPNWDNGAERAFRIGGPRSFYINRVWSGCPNDRGWLMASAQATCFWENTANGPTEIIYSRLSTESHIPTAADTGYADSMLIFLR